MEHVILNPLPEKPFKPSKAERFMRAARILRIHAGRLSIRFPEFIEKRGTAIRYWLAIICTAVLLLPNSILLWPSHTDSHQDGFAEFVLLPFLLIGFVLLCVLWVLGISTAATAIQTAQRHSLKLSLALFFLVAQLAVFGLSFYKIALSFHHSNVGP